MSSGWPAIIGRIIVAGSFIGWLVSVLVFFGLDAKTIGNAWQAMSAHYIFAIAAAAFFLVFVAALYYLWKNSRITPEGIEPKIRQWLDSFSLGTRKISNPTTYFAFEVRGQTEVPIAVLRTKEHPHYITFVFKIHLGSEHKPLFDKLSPPEKDQFVRRLRLEAAKARIAYSFDRDAGNLQIEKRLPITNNFTEADLIDGISEVNFSAIIVAETMVSLLEQGVKPDSTPDKTASPT